MRLGIALTLALAPVLVLSVAQSALNYRLEMRDRKAELVGAAERSASSIRARILSGAVLLQTIAPGSMGFDCAQRLAEIRTRIPGYQNLIRFDSIGRVACAAATAPPDPARRYRPWFRDLAQGGDMTITALPGVRYASEPVVLASVRAQDAEGHFEGVLTAVLSLASLQPERPDRSAPPQSDVAVIDDRGAYLASTSLAAFPATLGAHLAGAGRTEPQLWLGRSRGGSMRIFTSSPLVGHNVYVLLSAPYTVLSWAWVNPLSALLLPLLAFALALSAVWGVADRGVVRWIAYLRRIAAIYARGRYSVHPIKAMSGPPEIRDLARTMDAMAGLIATRDRALKESLSEKDGLMREIHHRVKNNLQVISSLLNMQQRALADPAARAAMSDTRQRITALALIYRALYQGVDLRRVDLREFLEDLIANLVTTETAGGGQIETHLSIDPLIIDPDRLAPLALFAVEAITNAKKHGLGDAGGALTVDFHVRGQEAELTITDSGREGVEPAVGEGVGRTLMTAFARQLGGTLTFQSHMGEGLTARLVFPAPSGVDELEDTPSPKLQPPDPVDSRARA
ncbi:MAG TPA: histidine kinase dimerization/phosphoacceptor domain -containing protein [Caulobacteraceae bacterium]